LLFVGEAVRFDTLKMTNLRDGAAPTVTVQAQVFRCPAAARRCRPVPRHPGRRLCQLRHRGRHRRPELQGAVARWASDEQYAPRLPLGSKGVLEDKPVEVIGFLVRRCKVDGIAYTGASTCWPASMAPIAG
jgi:hypothetical protein